MIYVLSPYVHDHRSVEYLLDFVISTNINKYIFYIKNELCQKKTIFISYLFGPFWQHKIKFKLFYIKFFVVWYINILLFFSVHQRKKVCQFEPNEHFKNMGNHNAAPRQWETQYHT